MNWHAIGYQGARLTFSTGFALATFAVVYWVADCQFWVSSADGLLAGFYFWWKTP